MNNNELQRLVDNLKQSSPGPLGPTTDWYILDDYQQMVLVDYAEWLQWSRDKGLVLLGNDIVSGVQVQTVFVGKPEHLFVTAEGPVGQKMEIVCGYRTWAQAEAGHQKRVKELKDQVG